ncbi:MAG: ABC-F family ATP-binding cassette domain-containing protein, partial [Bacilli bacterium]|nr:ABC-F family ATP-binding cassette domain-containing protein [Bacilli bacterium]
MLEIIDLKFGYGAQELFNKASVTIYNGEHVGLIGLNGVGKSTLMNLLAFRLTPDEGKIIWDKNVTFSYLDQQLEVKTDISITDYLYDVYTPLFKKEEEMNNLYNSLVDANPDDYDKILRKAENIQTFLDENNFYMIKSKIGNVINGLGIDIEEGRSLKELSGGQRAKVFLGKMLL